MDRTRPSIVWIVPSLLLALLSAAAPAQEGDVRDSRPIHAPGRTMERLAVEVTRALLRDDAPAARKALDGLAASCRRLTPEDRERFGDEIVATDSAFHITLNRAREYSGQGATGPTFSEFFYVQNTCRVCHEHARKLELLPAVGPLWNAAAVGGEGLEKETSAVRRNGGVDDEIE